MNSKKEWGVLLACPRSFCCCLSFLFFRTGGGCKFAPRGRDMAVHQSVERPANAWPAWRLQRCTNATCPAHLWCSGMFHCWKRLQIISLSFSISPFLFLPALWLKNVWVTWVKLIKWANLRLKFQICQLCRFERVHAGMLSNKMKASGKCLS